MSGKSEGIFIRAAGPEDAELATDFVYRLICELNGSKVDANLADYEKAFQELISNENNTIFIASDKGKAVGIITVVQSVAIYVPGSFGVIEVGAPNREAWQRTVDFYLREGFVEIGPRLKKYFE